MKKKIKVPFWFLNRAENDSLSNLSDGIRSIYNNCSFRIVNDREFGKITFRVMPQFFVYKGEKAILDSGYTNDYCFDGNELFALVEKIPQIMKDAHNEFIKNYKERSQDSIFKNFAPDFNERDFMKRFKLQLNQIEI